MISKKWRNDFKRGFKLHPGKLMAFFFTLLGFAAGATGEHGGFAEAIATGLGVGIVVWSIVLCTSPSVGRANPNE